MWWRGASCCQCWLLRCEVRTCWTLLHPAQPVAAASGLQFKRPSSPGKLCERLAGSQYKFALYDQDWGAGCGKMRVSVRSQGGPADCRGMVACNDGQSIVEGAQGRQANVATELLYALLPHQTPPKCPTNLGEPG